MTWGWVYDTQIFLGTMWLKYTTYVRLKIISVLFSRIIAISPYKWINLTLGWLPSYFLFLGKWLYGRLKIQQVKPY
jgi:hypothetical protein